MQKLWIASELFYPEETSTSFILTKIANKMASKYTVNVVCGNPVYDKNRKSKSFILNHNVKVHRIKTISGNKNSLLFRSLRFLFLSFRIFLYLIRNVREGDRILIVTNPAPLIILISILKQIKKVHVTILVHDVFPENTIPAKILYSEASIIYRILKHIFDFAYSKADQLIVLGRDMYKVLERKTKRFKRRPFIRIIENWGDIHSIYPIPKDEIYKNHPPLKNKVVFQFAGNLGRVQGLKELMEVIKNVNNNHIVFYFIGEGALKTEMMDMVTFYNISNVFFGDTYSRDKQVEILNQADISMVSLSAGMFGLGVPSKVYNILAAGVPILYIGEENTEIDLLIKENDIGYSFQKSDHLLAFFNDVNQDFREDLYIKKNNSRKIAEKYFSEEVILNKFYNSL
ncbi:glycosyltransferase WbuB [Chryseobacterium sp. 6424]|uniref:glycosyltransferase family 4 protein n=1 Tax=Chryseobacterium sp. 6424 TaxID=2039166 RepID=UPI000EFA58B0|nr:glycosyltransferase family 4 protein [Chryseobacterium sp. 6424]AYO57056.1 glycosyltransferase WbuB [Chryseobacterium sp. 6424]